MLPVDVVVEAIRRLRSREGIGELLAAGLTTDGQIAGLPQRRRLPDDVGAALARRHVRVHDPRVIAAGTRGRVLVGATWIHEPAGAASSAARFFAVVTVRNQRIAAVRYFDDPEAAYLYAGLDPRSD